MPDKIPILSFSSDLFLYVFRPFPLRPPFGDQTAVILSPLTAWTKEAREAMPRDPLSNFILPALICNAGDHPGGFDPVFLDLL